VVQAILRRIVAIAATGVVIPLLCLLVTPVLLVLALFRRDESTSYWRALKGEYRWMVRRSLDWGPDLLDL